MSEVAAAILRQFLLFAAILAPLELLVPARGEQRPWRRRGLATDLFHFALNPFLVGALAGAALAALAAGIHWLLPTDEIAAAQPYWLQFVEVFLLSELAGYWVHRLSHQIPWLWRFHAVHHTAEELDWVAAHRQHPLEATWMLVVANLPALLLGFSTEPLVGFILFQKLYTAFLHGNLRIGYGPLDAWLASPRFHHWHHDGTASVDRAAASPRPPTGDVGETPTGPPPRSRNYAGLFPWIDKLFGTYELPAGFPQSYGCDVPAESYPRQLLRPFYAIAPRRSEPTSRCQPSTATKIRIFTGSEINTGGNITMPRLDNTVATTRSMTRNGNNTASPI